MKTNLGLAFLLLLLGVARVDGADLERGRALFADPTLGGGRWGKSCLTCHEGGEGLERDFHLKKRFTIMGLQQNGLAEAVDFCIQVAMRGEGLAPDTPEWVDLIAYMRSLKQEAQHLN